MRGRLHHLALGAEDVEALAAFYRDVLGLPEVMRHANSEDDSLRSVWLDLGGSVLMIEKSQRSQRESTTEVDRGLFLLALTAAAEELEKCYENLEKLGFPPEKTSDFTRYYRDPEGNRFALSIYELPSG